MRGKMIGGVLAFLLAYVSGQAAAQQDIDRYVGYYYPAPQTRELYDSPVETLAEASKITRIAFVTAVTGQSMRHPYPPDYALFAKGQDSKKLIIVGLDSGRYNSLYRMRALLAIMTAMARTTPMFRETPGSENLNFLDMVWAMGFESVTISDGLTATHQIFLK
ncbi:hypothetical protein [Aestuariispira insulae]|uniref:Molybdopterin-guanine dinucleotide biosynthesis protein A n=1 Tax=Aestuariispira insulae TaxID=1461337 RepID=A0A3D9HS36_9PROT|nr:hypothetical protein [Aestuariispira insulae]RED52304.1 hypothetical protein DFP90_102324 [Aestuariispira insulae]